jgi:phosphoribosylamine-glycine ligase
MRVAFISLDGCTISWARRLLEEGCDVLLFVKKDRKNIIGKGIVPLATSLSEWLSWGAQDPNTVYMFDQTQMGELADSLRKSGKLVLNGGTFMDRLELDRHWGEGLATKCGVWAPPTYSFSSITETIEFLRTNPPQKFGDGGWAWKPDKDIGCDATLVAKDSDRIIDHVEHIRRRFSDNLKCILQEKIEGVAVSTARWWNGKQWATPMQATIENKKFLNDNLGPATGCSFNVVWFYKDTKEQKIHQALAWDKLEEVFRKEGAPPGLYDINAILNDKGAWFLEWTPRLGIDSEMTAQRAVSSLKDFVWTLATGGTVEHLINDEQCYFDVRLSVPPYPNHIETPGYKSPAIGIPVKGLDGLCSGMFVVGAMGYNEEEGFTVADDMGLLGYLVTSGRSMKKAYDEIYKYAKDELIVPDVQYRTDAVKVLQDDIDKMVKYGWPTTPYLRK